MVLKEQTLKACVLLKGTITQKDFEFLYPFNSSGCLWLTDSPSRTRMNYAFLVQSSTPKTPSDTFALPVQYRTKNQLFCSYYHSQQQWLLFFGLPQPLQFVSRFTEESPYIDKQIMLVYFEEKVDLLSTTAVQQPLSPVIWQSSGTLALAVGMHCRVE